MSQQHKKHAEEMEKGSGGCGWYRLCHSFGGGGRGWREGGAQIAAWRERERWVERHQGGERKRGQYTIEGGTASQKERGQEGGGGRMWRRGEGEGHG